jgi:hypothetical protein
MSDAPSQTPTRRVLDLENALLDMLDGTAHWYDIQAATGCSESRCREIERLYNQIRAERDMKGGRQ